MPWWSIRFSPTPGSSTTQSTPTSARWPAGPMPERIRSVGDCSAPEERMTRDARTCCSVPSRGYSTPVAAAALEQDARHLGVGPDRQVVALTDEWEVRQRGRHADAVAPVHRHRPDARRVRRVEVVDPGDPMVHHRGEEALLLRQELVALPADDGNRAVGAVGLAAEVLVGFEAAQGAQHVRPRPFVTARRGPALRSRRGYRGPRTRR